MSRCLSADDAAIQEAAGILQRGGLVAFPTETVYGLGADGLNPEAVARIYRAKGRPSNNPLILHVPGIAEARALAAEWPPEAQTLAERFWPGPLTLILPAAPCVPEITRAGNPSVALRCPDHPVALALLRATGRPLAAPSANPSQGLSPSRAEHVVKGLGDRVDLVLDGGPTSAGLESTILDLSRRPFRLLRPGPLAPSELEALAGPIQQWQGAVAEGAEQAAPGMSSRHYAPRARLELVPRSELMFRALEATGQVVAVRFGGLPPVPECFEGRRLPADPREAMAVLYAFLHDLDEEGFDRIFIEEPPEGEAWLAVRDRLRRASASPEPPCD
nr:L-threonylcarbamoyladenylate synthase [uncultured Holophaga sp.]